MFSNLLKIWESWITLCLWVLMCATDVRSGGGRRARRWAVFVGSSAELDNRLNHTSWISSRKRRFGQLWARVCCNVRGDTRTILGRGRIAHHAQWARRRRNFIKVLMLKDTYPPTRLVHENDDFFEWDILHLATYFVSDRLLLIECFEGAPLARWGLLVKGGILILDY